MPFYMRFFVNILIVRALFFISIPNLGANVVVYELYGTDFESILLIFNGENNGAVD